MGVADGLAPFFGVVFVLSGAIGDAVRLTISGELEGDRWGLLLGLAVEYATVK